MIKIGEFSKIAKTTIKTLRYYDDIGLFKPSFVDENGYRYYDIDQLKDLMKIISLRSFDLPIEKILEIFNGGDEKRILNEHISFLENEKKKKSFQITSLKKLLKGEKVMEFKANIKEIKENIVYYRHGVIDSMNDMFDFILEAGRRCGELNPHLECTGYCYVTYTAGEYKEKDVELEYVEATKVTGKEGNEIKFRVDPAIKALSVEVKGSYSNLFAGYEFALGQMKQKGYEIGGPIREVYIHGCWDQENEEDYLTEIQIPIK